MNDRRIIVREIAEGDWLAIAWAGDMSDEDSVAGFATGADPVEAFAALVPRVDWIAGQVTA